MLSTRQVFSKTIRFLSSNKNNKNVIKSVSKKLVIPQITLHELLWQNLDKYKDQTALTCLETKRSYTYAQLHKKSQILSGFLRNSFKLTNKQTIAVILPNLPEYPIILLAASQACLKVTTCNPTYSSAEILKQLENSEADLVFTATNLVETVRNAIKDLGKNIKIVEVRRGDDPSPAGVIKFEEITSGEPFTQQLDAKWDDTLMLPYSSGTTGLPKGVELTHFNLVANLHQMTTPEFKLFEEMSAVIPAFLPFFHIYGMVVILFQSLLTGNTIVTMPQFTPDTFIKLLQEYQPTHIYGIPLVVNMITNHPSIKLDHLSSLKMILSGAAPLRAEDIERFYVKTRKQTTLLQGYGMTESSPMTIQQSPWLSNGIKIGSSGLIVADTLAKIVSIESDSLEGLGPNQSGELLVKGPQVMKGYYKNPKATQEVITEDGWLKTGDIAHYDEDNHFYITDRLKELIKVKGFQVAPAELEAILRSHPDVADAGVVGIEHEKLGEAPKAFVVVKEGKTVKEEDIQKFVAEKVTQYKHLVGGVAFVEVIPKNASGKILRRILKNM